MTLLFLALWLQMSAPPLPGNGANCWYDQSKQWECIDPSGKITYPDWSKPRAADETYGKPGAHIYSIEELEAQGWKKSEISVCKYQVFADKRVELDGPDCPASVVREAMHPAEPVDVPAVQETRTYKTGTFTFTQAPGCAGRGDCEIVSGTPDTATEEITTCADKSRILEHDENSPPKYWCRKVEF